MDSKSVVEIEILKCQSGGLVDTIDSKPDAITGVRARFPSLVHF